MEHNDWLKKQAELTLTRLLPRLNIPDDERAVFVERLSKKFPRLFKLMYQLYGQHYDFFYHLEETLNLAAEMYCVRPAELRTLDRVREADRTWFQSEQMVGAVIYVDLFAGDLSGVRKNIAYFKELGITYLHLMPLFKAPLENSDGGYAVSSYRDVNPALGTMDDLRALAADLRAEGISLVLDFIFNHTSDEHTWALLAREGDERYLNFYRTFPDRTLPDQYERTLREIFPEQSPGNFTYVPALGRWVWTTFWHFQWDLNYENPEVLTAMMGEMLFLANVGVDVLRLDAVAFVWKQMGTISEGLPEAHMVIQALNALIEVVAPAMIFKSEAIVHPDEVASYIGWEEAPISYNPTLMAMIWDSLATRKIEVLSYAMSHRYDLPPDSVWVNYLRVHDDIGWSFADEDAIRFGVNGYDHRQFLNAFYTGSFEGSFAKGLPFGYNAATGDMRISGTLASLAGLEQALERDDDTLIENALRRIEMMFGIIMAAGGIPLIYLGDEIATLNDYSYRDIPGRAADSRWAHRPAFDWNRAKKRSDESHPAGRVFQTVQRLITVRKSNPVFGKTETRWFYSGNMHVLAFIRGETVLCLFNFSEYPQHVRRQTLASQWTIPAKPLDLAHNEPFYIGAEVVLEPYQFVWLKDGSSGK